MILKKIKFYNFRNFDKGDYFINPFLTIIIGENARGKTNLLEGIHFLINGVGFRESKEEELIYFDSHQASVEGIFQLENETIVFKAMLDKKPSLEGKGEVVEKHFFINKTKKKHFQYLKEQIKTVLFSPEQIEIIIGSPAMRRDYFNKLISFYDYEYKKKLDNYENAIRRRNKILEKHYDVSLLQEELKFWNDYLINQAVYITKKRQEHIDFLNKNQKLDNKEFSIRYLKNEFSLERLNKVFEEEKRWRKTLVGPQKDDFQIYLKNPPAGGNIHHYGSRSEQRMAVFWLKMNEILYHEETYKKKPILLLDDVFSELDLHNKKIVIGLIKKYQTLITTTDKEVINIAEVPNTIIHL